jgi:hypothetical protein
MEPKHIEAPDKSIFSFLGLPSDLPSAIEEQYKIAKNAGELVYTKSEVAVIHTNAGIPVRASFLDKLQRLVL